MPGAEMGRAPRTRSSVWKLAEGSTRGVPAPASSVAMTSARARPSQLMEASLLRFSRRSTARRSTGAPAGCRMQLVKSNAIRTAGKAWPHPVLLENTRLQGEQLFEFGQLAQRGKCRVFGQLLALFIA